MGKTIDFSEFLSISASVSFPGCPAPAHSEAAEHFFKRFLRQRLFPLLLLVLLTFFQLLLHSVGELCKLILRPAQFFKQFRVHLTALQLLLQSLQSQSGGLCCFVDFCFVIPYCVIC